MAENKYAVPIAPSGLSAGLDTILTALQHRRERQREEEDRALRLRSIQNEEQRTSNEEYRRRTEADRQHRIELANAVTSAAPMLESQPSLAKVLLGAHGITTTPEMSQPTVFTPAMALAAANKPEPPAAPTGNPVSFEPSPTAAPVTPLNAFGRRDEHVGTTVPELQPTGFAGGGIDNFTDEQRRRAAENVAGIATGTHLGSDRTQAQTPGMQEPPAVPPPTVTTGGHAVEDLLPMTEDGKPTGAMSFRGPDGMDLGRFDPEEKKRYEADKAAAAANTLGPLGQDYARIASAVARGEIPEKVGDAMLASIASANNMRERQAAMDKRQELHQKFLEAEHSKYSETHAGRVELANIRARMMAMISGTATPADMTHLAELLQNFQQHGDIGQAAAEAGSFKPPLQPKIWEPAIKQVVTQAGAAERSDQKREGLKATGPNKEDLGYWNNPSAATKGPQIIQRFHRVDERMDALIKDIEQNGERIDVDSKQYVRRMSLAKAAAAALRPYNELSSTDASMKSEEMILGPTGAFGHGWTLGADLQTLKRIRDEARGQYQVNLNTMLQSKAPLAPALSGGLGRPSGGNVPTGAGVTWGPIPVRLRNKPEYAGKTQISVDADGNITGSR